MKTDDTYTQNALEMLAFLRRSAEHKGFTQQEIAAKTGLIQTNVSRTLLGKYVPRLDLFLKLAAAVGVEVTIKFKKP